MFREMRRKKQALSLEESAEVLMRGSAGVLALSGDDGYPYAVPISYVYDWKSVKKKHLTLARSYVYNKQAGESNGKNSGADAALRLLRGAVDGASEADL